MFIKGLQLVEFKRFDNTTIDLGDNPKRIVALVGPNGSGKSSIFDAFEEITKDYKSGSSVNPASYFWKKFFKDEVGGTYDKHDCIRITRSDNLSSFDKKSFYLRTSYRYTSQLNITQLKKLNDVLEDQRRPSSSIHLDTRLQENYERLIGLSFKEWQIGDKTGSEWRAEMIDKINGIFNNILDIKISNIGDIYEGRGQLYFEKGNSFNFPFENLSSGEKEVVDIILDLFVKSKDYDNTVYCIDEPELHLNTAIQRKLIIEIEKLIPPNCQLWVATHSLGFLRALQEDLVDKTSIIDFSNANFDEPTVLKPIVPTRQNWQRIFKTALDDVAGLLAPGVIIYCEGRKEPSVNGDEQGLDAKAYNKIFSTEYPDVLFVSSGGNTELEKYSSIAISILGKAFIDARVFILKDCDINRDGSPTSLTQRTEWILANPIGRMLKRREIENYLYDKEIFKKYNPEFNEQHYDEIVSDILSQDLKLVSTEEIFGLLGIIPGSISLIDVKLALAELITPDTNVYGELKDVIFSV